MRIGDLKIGAQYGALDKADVREFPRRVRVEEIVVVPEGRWESSGWGRKDVNVRKARVVFMDEPLSDIRSSRFAILAAAKDASLVIEAKQIVAPWREVRAKVGKEIDRIARERDLFAETQARLRSVGIDPDYVYISLYVPEDKRTRPKISLRFDDREAQRILSLAEKGAAS